VHAFIFVKLIFLGRQVWGGRSVKIFGYLACGVLEGFFLSIFIYIFYLVRNRADDDQEKANFEEGER
jgi:hypothetical protein